MPNGAATEGRSFTPWVAGPGLSDADAALVRRLLAVMGEDAQVESEAQLDYLSALSGSGSAYPALMAQARLAAGRGGTRGCVGPCFGRGAGSRPIRH